MKELEKKVAEAELKKVKDEILTYANKDELANQVVTRTLYCTDDTGDYPDENAGGREQ